MVPYNHRTPPPRFTASEVLQRTSAAVKKVQAARAASEALTRQKLMASPEFVQRLEILDALIERAANQGESQLVVYGTPYYNAADDELSLIGKCLVEHYRTRGFSVLTQVSVGAPEVDESGIDRRSLIITWS